MKKLLLVILIPFALSSTACDEPNYNAQDQMEIRQEQERWALEEKQQEEREQFQDNL